MPHEKLGVELTAFVVVSEGLAGIQLHLPDVTIALTAAIMVAAVLL